MKNIMKLIQNSDFSHETQISFYNRIANISNAIEKAKKHYVEGKKLLTTADANLIKAIVQDDYEAMQAAEHAIIQIVNDLRETREDIKHLTIRNLSFYNMLLNHQKKEENIYVLPRKQVFELLKALSEGVKAQPDFKALEIAINTGFLKK